VKNGELEYKKKSGKVRLCRSMFKRWNRSNIWWMGGLWKPRGIRSKWTCRRKSCL